LGYYLTNLDNWIATGTDVQRLSSQRAMERLDMTALKLAAIPPVDQGETAFKAYLHRVGRYDDFEKKFVSKRS
jgi:hypothetical protein